MYDLFVLFFGLVILPIAFSLGAVVVIKKFMKFRESVVDAKSNNESEDGDVANALMGSPNPNEFVSLIEKSMSEKYWEWSVGQEVGIYDDNKESIPVVTHKKSNVGIWIVSVPDKNKDEKYIMLGLVRKPAQIRMDIKEAEKLGLAANGLLRRIYMQALTTNSAIKKTK